MLSVLDINGCVKTYLALVLYQTFPNLQGLHFYHLASHDVLVAKIWGGRTLQGLQMIRGPPSGQH